MKRYRGSKGISHSFIMLWSASCPVYFTPRERIPFTHRIGGWLCRGASLDILENGNISWPYQELNPVSLSLSCDHYTDYTVPTITIMISKCQQAVKMVFMVKMCCRFVGMLTKLRKVTISFVVYVTCNNSICLGWIFMKCDI